MTLRQVAPVVALMCAAARGGGGDRDVGASAPTPTAVELVGSYDLATRRDDDTMSGVAAVAFDGGELVLRLAEPAAGLHGTLQRDGAIALTGRTTVSDAVTPFTGSARAEGRDGTLRIAGALDDGSAFVLFGVGGGCFFGAHCHLAAVGVLPVATGAGPTRGSYSYGLECPPSAISSGDIEITRLGGLP